MRRPVRILKRERGRRSTALAMQSKNAQLQAMQVMRKVVHEQAGVSAFAFATSLSAGYRAISSCLLRL